MESGRGSRVRCTESMAAVHLALELLPGLLGPVAAPFPWKEGRDPDSDFFVARCQTPGH